ncbi:MAG TPA: hypothetical protein VF809_00505 [Candidatus Saccharimonadales bacterium]
MAERASKKASKPSTRNNAQRSSDITIEWICFGLWEWVLITLSVLLSATLTYYFFDNGGDYTFTLYFMAAMLCLMPFALVTERMYAKREPKQKHGFGGVVVVINAVAVFVATVGAFIAAVMNILSVFVDANTSSSTYAAISSSFVVAILGLLLFIRIISPVKFRKYTKVFPWIVVGISLATVIAASFGPFKSQIANRDDRFIENNLPAIDETIRSYTDKNRRLPASLNDIAMDESDNSYAMIKRNLVKYTANTKESEEGSEHESFYYELCVNFQKSKGSSRQASKVDDLYTLRSSHAAGEQCYGQRADVYGYKTQH